MPERSRGTPLRAVLNTVVDGVILIDATGEILMFNPACETLFGYTGAEVVGRNVKLLMPAPFHGEHDNYLGNYQRTGERKIIGIGREVVGRRKDGSVFPMELSVGEAREEHGAVFVGIIRDLTARNRAEQALQDMASRLKAVLETAVDGMILIDSAGSVLMFNPACERLFGYNAAEVLGQNVKLLMPTPFHEEHDTYLENYHRTGVPKIVGIGREVLGRRKDGSTFPMDLSVGEAKRDGQATFVGIIHDLTDRRKTEAQLVQAQKMEAVGQLSGGIAHDFNNLLTVIIGNAESLRENLRARPDLKILCDAIMNAGDRGAELTRRLLAFSRRQTLQPVAVDCNRLVEGIRALLRRTLREDIDIRTSCEPGLIAAFADPAQLDAALLNLALNAQDAMPSGGTLTIATASMPLDQRYCDDHPEVVPGDYVLISVTDDGVGMPSSVRERAFEPFFTTKEVGKGTGLGLSMVYGFVKQSNGHVAIYSEASLGTTVRIYLPPDKSSAGHSAPKHDSAPEPAGGSGTILVVEDDAFVRGYAVALLESLGYRVIVAASGREALDKLAGGPSIDLLFSDIVMPGGVSGWELAERAQALKPGLRILLTSGYSLETLATQKPGSRLVVLNKPYRKADLAHRLKELWESGPPL